MPLNALTLPSLVAERPDDIDAVAALIARAFGPGRFAKAAERLREGNLPILDLSFVAWEVGRAVGCVRLWPIIVGSAPGLLLGPIAVDADHRGQGLGAALIERACAAATAADHAFVLLVGDEPYFGAMGFAGRPARYVIMPDPVDQKRVLARALTAGGADDLFGHARARVTKHHGSRTMRDA
ncbi:MAG TPA: N-acetyltransferase [Caulobacteraceae bacterium]|nr:N-acetyltransferase [Caulobacteraceae bacterium]